ncbi:MAG: hypothetical protein J6N67_04970, partial [Desulfovibrio sp.]|nr:hypothetical protein [Desulfovibrio sp.]
MKPPKITVELYLTNLLLQGMPCTSPCQENAEDHALPRGMLRAYISGILLQYTGRRAAATTIGGKPCRPQSILLTRIPVPMMKASWS